jgi:hypothetical protein
MTCDMVVGFFTDTSVPEHIVRNKNRRVWVWLLFGLIFPVFSLVILMFAYPLEKDGWLKNGVG